ncbi:Small-conductance mechanosensitive channel [Dehalogenimonas formicexedens]|uniref:Small-conductance mechanosensitive channel n=1 Tax=Dehalogenimonas formicexedens TaxID=1839801 RepID=A0A1P8F4S9_9CHLR|nr:mechanosensitive ion channel domain-containing protein [Dehalogenimonas formicexedens]APV43479.1 Small-conductance mechanosensitive channel [Dehalogenimonas formicexedens]
MVNKIITVFILLALSIGAAVALFRYPENVYLQRALSSGLTLAGLYLVFKLILEEAVARSISEIASRFNFRRVMSAFFFIGAAIALTNIWINAQNLLVAYGLIGAGVALALQDLFKNLAGGLMLFTRGTYRIGDRVEVNSKKGDVIDIGLLNTTLLEIGEWVGGDQPTGRLCQIPNGFILSHAVHNYTRDHHFIWDEINIPLTYDSDWHLALDTILKLVTIETKAATTEAQDSFSRLAGRYFLPGNAGAPSIFVTLTDNWINLTVRYISEVRNRRETRDRLNRLILDEITRLGSEKVRISSQTLGVSVKPESNGGTRPVQASGS